MRDMLSQHEGKALKVIATIERYGRTSSTYLLKNIRQAPDDDILTDHIWIEIGPWASGFRPGDTIEFEAIVIPYIKGYTCDLLDWTLGTPRNASVLKFGPTLRLMPDGSIRP